MGAWDGLLLAAYRPELVGAIVLADGGYFQDVPAGVAPEEFVDVSMGRGWYDRLNAVLPSIMDTAANRKSMPNADYASWPKVSEVAATIAFLASPQNTVTRGALVPVYGAS